MGLPLVPVQVVHERLIKAVASAGVSSDALSSTADATEELLLGPPVAAAASASGSFLFVLPMALAIAALLWIVGISDRQTSDAYTMGQHDGWSRAMTVRDRREQTIQGLPSYGPARSDAGQRAILAQISGVCAMLDEGRR